MADLIDRRTAIDEIKSVYEWHDTVTMERLIEHLNNLPSAERHGKWIHDGCDFPHGVDWMHCSECGKIGVYCPAAMTNYCPHCGARMDGE